MTAPALLVLLALPVLLAVPAAAVAQPIPVYRLSVHLDADAHTVRGTLKVEVAPDDPRAAASVWYLHLPPNRFLEPDDRGPRLSTDSLPFATNFQAPERVDPVQPSGFSAGRIALHAVESAGAQALPHALEDNPEIPQGFSVRNGLLRVERAPGSAPAVVIRFTTHLPERYWDGWSEAGILTDRWHPVLANLTDGDWVRDVFAPTPGRFAVSVTVTGAGRLFMGRAWQERVSATRPFHMPLNLQPLRTLPLVFVQPAKRRVRHGYEYSLYSYFADDAKHTGELALRVADTFLDFAWERYRLTPPTSRIAIVQVDLPPGDIRTVGSLILVPREYYYSSVLLDRVFVAQLSRAIAQIWFGEAVWSHRDRQHWLHLGLSGFLALDFFTELFGWNAGIHDLVDWLQPKYREHFFESPVRTLIRAEDDRALLVSLQEEEGHRAALIVAHNKAPLVMRSLKFVAGAQTFARSLNALYHRRQFTTITDETFAAELSRQTGRNLQPLFESWFRETPTLDFAVEDLESTPHEDGYEVRVHVTRGNEAWPVEVEIVLESERRIRHRWEENGTEAVLRFVFDEPAIGAVIDPDEHWLETDRRNNFSDVQYRVRPIYDWPKQSELFVALRGTAGGNSVDGNYVGLGVRVQINENNRFEAIPIYGERTGLDNYRVGWQWTNALHPRLSFGLEAEQLGGARVTNPSITWRMYESEDTSLDWRLDLRAETIRPVGLVDNGEVLIQPAGDANNVGLSLDYLKVPSPTYGARIDLSFTDARERYESDFDFKLYSFRLAQRLHLGHRNLVILALQRSGSADQVPLQKRHPMGGPTLLRGYPRILELANEEVAGVRLDYGLVLTRDELGTALQIRRMTLFLFADGARGWNNDEHHDSRVQRQDAGIGMEWLVNILRLAEFPLRVDIAWPINDDEFTEPQLILFGLLNF